MRRARDLLITAVVGFAVPIGLISVMWFAPIPRTWWSLALFVGVLLMPAAVVAGRHPRRRRGRAADGRAG
jgi:hypothetical protein